jgi:cation transport ATPase
MIGRDVMNGSKSNMAPKPYHPVTRWLHAGLVLGVIFQLTCAALMAHPKHNDEGHAMTHTKVAVEEMHHPTRERNTLGESLMEAHRAGGILVALIVFANLLWAIIPRGKPQKRQISVIFSILYWREAWLVLKHLCLIAVGRGGLPKPGNSLSLIVEMLGLLTMTAMAVSGAVIWNMWAGLGNKVTEQAEALMGVHGAIAMLLFLYLLGHVLMALLHMRSGDAVFARISPIALKK